MEKFIKDLGVKTFKKEDLKSLVERLDGIQNSHNFAQLETIMFQQQNYDIVFDTKAKIYLFISKSEDGVFLLTPLLSRIKNNEEGVPAIVNPFLAKLISSPDITAEQLEELAGYIITDEDFMYFKSIRKERNVYKESEDHSLVCTGKEFIEPPYKNQSILLPQFEKKSELVEFLKNTITVNGFEAEDLLDPSTNKCTLTF